MLAQTVRFAFSCVLLVILAWVSSVNEIGRAISGYTPYFDKYLHAWAGILLIAGAFDVLKKTACLAFGYLVLWNIAWETMEVLSVFTPWPIIPSVFNLAWHIDTAGDIIVTIAAGMFWWKIFYKK